MRTSDLVALVVLAMVLLPSAARADYILTPVHDGNSSAIVEPGDSVTLTIDLDSNAGDEHVLSLFRVVFSSPGLIYESYAWAQPPYANGTPDDDSRPVIGELPVLLTAETLSGLGYADGVVDIELSNVTEDGGAGPPPGVKRTGESPRGGVLAPPCACGRGKRHTSSASGTS
jgi:hypothetical protein